MHVTSQTDHDALPPAHSLENEGFTTVLLVEEETSVAQVVQKSLAGVLDDTLRFECVPGLVQAHARLAKGAVEVILVGTSVSDCGCDHAVEQLDMAAPAALVLPLNTPGPRDRGADDPNCDRDAHWLPRILKYITRRRQHGYTPDVADQALFEKTERTEITFGSTADAVFVADQQGLKSKACPIGAKRRAFDAGADGLEGRLQDALETGEFALHYQPQGDLATGAVVGLEALLRWRDPEGGLLSPNRFIALAERTGLVVPIGRWVLAETCRQVRAWQAAGLNPPPVSINVSPVELRQNGFSAGVAAILRNTGMDADRVRLELPEGVVMHLASGPLRALRALRGQGVGLTIDGFGNGPPSLGCLRRLPVDTIKTHRALLRNVTTAAESAVLLRTILGWSSFSRNRAIAHGVETEQQRSFLLEGGWAVGQGFHLGAAGDGDEIAMLLATHGPRQPARDGAA